MVFSVSLHYGSLTQPSVENLLWIASKCIKEESVAHVVLLYSYIQRNGLDTHISLGNYFVTLLVESGNVPCAQKAFEKLDSKNEISWNSLIKGYVESHDMHQAFALYQKMGEEGLVPSEYVMVMLIKSCTKMKDVERGIEIHVHISKNGLLQRDVYIGSSLVDMYAKCGFFTKAQQVFDDLPIRNVVSWNVMISGYVKHDCGKEALYCFEQMQLEGISPNVVTYICALRACAKVQAIEIGSKIHEKIHEKGFLEKDVVIGVSLVDMYAKCGSVVKAQEVFDNIPNRSSTIWNALIGGYTKHECCDEALNCFKQMKYEGVSPDALTFASILRACAGIGAIDEGREIHNEIKRNAIEDRHIIVGNALVDMYAKCGFLFEAYELFHGLKSRDIVSWNALIAGYAKFECEEEVLNCFEQMTLEGISPDIITFSCSLKACGSMGLINKGRDIHAEIERKGLVDMVIGNALVTMYSRCGLLAKAQEAFENLEEQGIVSWNAMISGYVGHDCGMDALNCFKQMQFEGVSPNTITFVCCLKACGDMRSENEGKRVHCEVIRKGLLESSPVLGAALVDMYAKSGLLIEAQGVFEKLPSKGIAAWNALISGYAECECGEFALTCFDKMQVEGVIPDAVTFACSLKACGTIGDMEKGSEIHAEIEKNGLIERDIVVGNALLDMYAKCGSIPKACEVFEKLPLRNVVSWSTLIACYAKHEKGEDALKCFEEMKLKGVSPDAITFACSLKACACIGAVSRGIEIHGEIEKTGLLGRDSIVGNALVDMYAKCGYLSKAEELLYSFCKRDAISWNALIAGYVKYKQDEAALNSFEKMQVEGISPDSVTLAYVLKACGSIGAGEKGTKIHIEMDRKILLEQSLIIGNALMDMHAKCGFLMQAHEVFDKISDADIISWNVLIAGEAQFGQCEDVFHILDTMETIGVNPDSATFLSVLHACNHGGLLFKAQIFFRAMIQDYGITPTTEHYTSMIDLFSRAGQVDKAVAMLEKLPVHPDIVMCCTLLGACKKWGNLMLAKQAFDYALGLDEKEASAYISMFNIYADARIQKYRKMEELVFEKPIQTIRHY